MKNTEPHMFDCVEVPISMIRDSTGEDHSLMLAYTVLYSGVAAQPPSEQKGGLSFLWRKRLDDDEFLVYVADLFDLYVTYEKKTGIYGFKDLERKYRLLCATQKEHQIEGACFYADYFERVQERLLAEGVLSPVLVTCVVGTLLVRD